MKTKNVFLTGGALMALVSLFASAPAIANTVNSIREEFLLNSLKEFHTKAQDELHQNNTDFRRIRLEKQQMIDTLELEIAKIDESVERNKRLWDRHAEAIKLLEDPQKLHALVQENAKKTVAEAQEDLNFQALTFITPERAKTVMRIAKNHNIIPEDLLALCQQESGCDDAAIGDNGNSFGAFQINTLYHPDEKECAKDLACSAQWASARMLRLGYDKDNINARYHAIRCHNGCAKDIDNHWYPQSVLTKSNNISKALKL